MADAAHGGNGATAWVWELPCTGMTWCDCGQGHELTRAVVWEHARALGYARCVELTGQELLALCMAVWNYDAVCSFFVFELNEAIRTVYGQDTPHVPIGVALDVVGYFSKKWQGCPEGGELGG